MSSLQRGCVSAAVKWLILHVQGSCMVRLTTSHWFSVSNKLLFGRPFEAHNTYEQEKILRNVVQNANNNPNQYLTLLPLPDNHTHSRSHHPISDPQFHLGRFS
jgi:hypothetical protein